jgi:hypothetical protein
LLHGGCVACARAGAWDGAVLPRPHAPLAAPTPPAPPLTRRPNPCPSRIRCASSRSHPRACAAASWPPTWRRRPSRVRECERRCAALAAEGAQSSGHTRAAQGLMRVSVCACVCACACLWCVVCVVFVAVDGVVYVVDSGMVKQKSYQPSTGMDSLDVVAISRWAVRGRAARAVLAGRAMRAVLSGRAGLVAAVCCVGPVERERGRSGPRPDAAAPARHITQMITLMRLRPLATSHR